MAGVTWCGGKDGYPMVFGVPVYIHPSRLIEAMEAAALDVDGRHWSRWDVKRLEEIAAMVRRKVEDREKETSTHDRA